MQYAQCWKAVDISAATSVKQVHSRYIDRHVILITVNGAIVYIEKTVLRLAMKLALIIIITFAFLLTASSADDLLELSCATDDQCTQYERARCRDGHCVCTAAENGQRVACKPKDKKLSNIIGGPCTEDHVCMLPHAVCDIKLELCFCTADHIASEDRRRCLPSKVALNGPCELSSQCQKTDKFAVCQEPQRSCQCKPNFEQHLGRCVALLDLPCTKNSKCNATDAICLPNHKKCACGNSLVHNQNMTTCLPGAEYDSNCTTSEQCQLNVGIGGMCSNHTCNCRPKYYATVMDLDKPEQIICEPIVAYGAYCSDNKDCQMQKLNLEQDQENRDPTSTSMECLWGECRCRDNHHAIDNLICVPSTSKANPLQNMLHFTIPFQLIWLVYSRI